MIYLSIKALHLLALMTWVCVMLASPWIMVWADDFPASLRARALTDVRHWYRLCSVPAMLGTWSMGIVLGSLGAWFSSPWLSAKLMFVVILSGLHGVLSGQLRRLCTETDYRLPSWIGHLFWLELALIAGVVGLVVFKPG